MTSNDNTNDVQNEVPNEESNEENDELICAICQNTEQGTFTKLECGHYFHCECAIKWFRSGYSECPMCRQYPNELLHGWECRTHRLNFLIKEGRKKKASKRHKYLTRMINISKKKWRSDRIQFHKYLKSKKYKDVIKRKKKLKAKSSSSFKMIKNMESQLLAEFSHISAKYFT